VSILKLKTLLGDYPVTEALKKNRIESEKISLDFADLRTPSAGFKRVVRDLEFDVAELAITTFLIAKSFGKPLKLLPAVLVARLQHSFLVHNAERGARVEGTHRRHPDQSHGGGANVLAGFDLQ
jgi:4,5-dihydroxyphthalate decarboxylase